MRPVRRGHSPVAADFTDYSDAKPHLVSRIGSYCSFCERKINTVLAVEHIQPKSLAAYRHLVGRWTNFLLACVNCNSCKKDEDVLLTDYLLPDRDNTFAAFNYSPDGTLSISTVLNANANLMASRIMVATGLDKRICTTLDENGKQVALDRVSQRLEAWAVATDSRTNLSTDPTSVALRRCIVELALATGFFSIWMTVFNTDTQMRNDLIDAFAGTRGSGCFDPTTTNPVSPAPNPDTLDFGGKI